MSLSLRNLDLRKMGRNRFSNVVDERNGLGNHIVSAKSIGSFKRRSDKFTDKDNK